MAIDFKVTTLTYFSKQPVRLLVCQMMYLKCVVTVVSIKLHVVTVVSIKLHVVTVLSIKLHVFQKGVIYKHLLTACLDIG